MSGFTPESRRRCIRSIEAARHRHAAASDFALGIAGAYILKESQRHVPLEFGPLHDSGQVTKNGKGFKAEARVAYTTDYAAAVHEKVDMVLKGEPRPSGFGRYWEATRGWGSAKFLERVPREQRRDIIVTYVRGFQEHLKRVVAAKK